MLVDSCGRYTLAFASASEMGITSGAHLQAYCKQLFECSGPACAAPLCHTFGCILPNRQQPSCGNIKAVHEQRIKTDLSETWNARSRLFLSVPDPTLMLFLIEWNTLGRINLVISNLGGSLYFRVNLPLSHSVRGTSDNQRFTELWSFNQHLCSALLLKRLNHADLFK